MHLNKAIILILLLSTQNIFYIDQNKIDLQQVSKHVWIHTSYSQIGGSWVDSHGLIISNENHIILIDTCWTNEQTSILLQKVYNAFIGKIDFAIITHAHQDRIGGIDELYKNNIKAISTPLTAQKAAMAGYRKPLPEIDKKSIKYNVASASNFQIEAFYPGPGHTEDNITVYIPDDSLLFGGCLLKANENSTLGNLADSVVSRWASSIQELIIRYPDTKIVVPGHGIIGNASLLSHTIDLLNKESKN